jgi:phage terminase Nu1 subunit (DNA packaging protein)
VNQNALTDAELAQVLECKPARVKKLRKQGVPVNADGTFNFVAVFGFLCELAKRRRKE